MNNNRVSLQHKHASIDYQSEFMKNYVAESIIEGAKDIKAVRLAGDAVLLFFTDAKGHLHVISTANGDEDGWHTAILSHEGATTSSFDVHCNEQADLLRIAYAAEKENKLYLSKDLDLKNFDIAQLKAPDLFGEKPLPANQEVNFISIYDNDVLFSTTSEKSDAMYYVITGGRSPVQYTLPENSGEVVQLMLGKYVYGTGVFVLYKMPQGNETILYQALITRHGDEPTQRRLETGHKITCFDLVPDKEGNSIVYTGGEGIYRFLDEETREPVTAPDKRRFTRLSAASTSPNDTAIWVVGEEKGNSGLYYITSAKSADTDTQSWTAPLQMHTHVQKYASLKGNFFTNQLFLLSNETSLSRLFHCWQDAASGNWSEQAVGLKNGEQAAELDTYTIDIQVGGTGNGKEPSGKMAIECAESCLLYINNRKYALKAGQAQEIDLTPNINIIYPTTSLAVPALALTADFLDSPVVIDPSTGVQQKLKEKIKNGHDLKEAKRQNGKLLINEHLDDKTLNEAASNMLQALSHFASTPHPIATPAKAAFAVHANGTTGTQAPSCIADGAFTGNLVGDIFYVLKKGFLEIKRFTVNIVREGVEFIMHIGSEVIKWIASTVKDAIALVERIWEKVKVFFKDLVEYLAFLFDWQDIVDSKDALVLTVKKGLQQIPAGLTKAKQEVTAQLANWKQQLEALIVPGEEHNTTGQKIDTLLRSASQLPANQADARIKWVDSKQEVIFQTKSAPLGTLQLPGLQKIKSDSEDPTLKSFVDTVVALFRGHITLGVFLQRMGKLVVEISYELLHKVADILFDDLIASVEQLEAILTAGIKVPLISAIYRNISSKPLSILDFMCLLIAIPMTIGYKLANNTAPFKQLSKETFADKTLLSFNIQ